MAYFILQFIRVSLNNFVRKLIEINHLRNIRNCDLFTLFMSTLQNSVQRKDILSLYYKWFLSISMFFPTKLFSNKSDKFQYEKDNISFIS